MIKKNAILSVLKYAPFVDTTSRSISDINSSSIQRFIAGLIFKTLYLI